MAEANADFSRRLRRYGLYGRARRELTDAYKRDPEQFRFLCERLGIPRDEAEIMLFDRPQLADGSYPARDVRDMPIAGCFQVPPPEAFEKVAFPVTFKI